MTFFKKKITTEEMAKNLYFATVLDTVEEDLKDKDGNIILTKKELILMLTQHLYVLFEKYNLGKAKLLLLTTHVVNSTKIKNNDDLTFEMAISLDAIEKIRTFLQQFPAPEESHKFFKAKFLFEKDLDPMQKTLAMARYVAYCKVIDSVFESTMKKFKVVEKE